MIVKEMQTVYLDWVNNFLTVEKFAEYYGFTEDEAFRFINLAREIHERIVRELSDEKT